MTEYFGMNHLNILNSVNDVPVLIQKVVISYFKTCQIKLVILHYQIKNNSLPLISAYTKQIVQVNNMSGMPQPHRECMTYFYQPF